MHRHMLAKIIGGGEEKQKYPARKCITWSKRSETWLM
jgi:hypothetical protein